MAPKQKPHRSKQDYQTPLPFIIAVKELLGITDFSFDLAASKENALSYRYFTKEQDALLQPQDWKNLPSGWAWCNPPFNDIEPWVRAAYLCKKNIAMLLPASVGSNWWKNWVNYKARVLFLNGRLSFIPEKPNWLYPKDCALLLFGDVQPGYEVWSWREHVG